MSKLYQVYYGISILANIENEKNMITNEEYQNKENHRKRGFHINTVLHFGLTSLQQRRIKSKYH